MTQTIEQLQAKVAELTSNVSKWASLAEANQQVAESAQRRADKLAAEVERLLDKLSSELDAHQVTANRGLASEQEYYKTLLEINTKVDDLRAKFAASQLNNKLLRDWISKKSTHSYSCDCLWLDDDGKQMACSCGMTEALSQPSDTSALDAYVAEKVKEAGKFDMWRTNPYTKVLETSIKQLTKQRDLAVEALEWAADVLPPSDPGGIGGCDCPVCRALETIKESDGK